MSDPSNPTAGAGPVAAGRTRPGVVSAAVYLLYLTAVLMAVNALLGLLMVGGTRRVFREAYAGTEVEGIESLMVAVVVATVVVSLLFAAGVVVLGVLDSQGRNAARIVTWAVGGLAVCCTGLGLANSQLTGVMNPGGSDVGLPDPDEVQRRVDEALPAWFGPVTNILGVLSMLTLLVALILLALPAAHAFFRRPRPAWQAPMPGAVYPGQQLPGGGWPGHPHPGSGAGWPRHPASGPAGPQQPTSGPAWSHPGHPGPGPATGESSWTPPGSPEGERRPAQSAQEGTEPVHRDLSTDQSDEGAGEPGGRSEPPSPPSSGPTG